VLSRFLRFEIKGENSISILTIGDNDKKHKLGIKWLLKNFNININKLPNKKY